MTLPTKAELAEMSQAAEAVLRAIDRSIQEDRIVRLDSEDGEIADLRIELVARSDDSAEGLLEEEYWGEEEGAAWRVHLVPSD